MREKRIEKRWEDRDEEHRRCPTNMRSLERWTAEDDNRDEIQRWSIIKNLMGMLSETVLINIFKFLSSCMSLCISVWSNGYADDALLQFCYQVSLTSSREEHRERNISDTLLRTAAQKRLSEERCTNLKYNCYSRFPFCLVSFLPSSREHRSEN